MKIEQKNYLPSEGWKTVRNDRFDATGCNLVMVFGSKSLLEDNSLYGRIRESYPKAIILMNSTSGEILDTKVSDNSISLTAILFEKTILKTGSVKISDFVSSFDAGCALADQLDPVGLKNVLIISDGQMVNGSELVSGLQSRFPAKTLITGGMAGDGANFKSTRVGLNDSAAEGMIAAIGFYGSLQVTFGSIGGWDSFGPERAITKSKDNILYELDNKPALDIYKKYLGDQAKDLPGSGLFYPLSIRLKGTDDALVRTIIAVNEEEKSLTFAGNMPEGFYARLMKANAERLIDGSSEAAANSLQNTKPELALLISCVGRKLILDQRIEEEVEVIREVYGDKTAITGFYSYGEIAPSFNCFKSELHNQTMTITTFTEE
ncbi:MAG TPA: FIST N-terminal domain-containing protein [Bacteroidia bacterium]|nr:FIST N-terminal domain-containing protein [Bacteroidia bacterium]